MLRVCWVLLGLLCPWLALAGDPALWLRYPAISPDGKTIVFCYRGDLYKTDPFGETTMPLTLYEGQDFRPVWSHDGKWIAFASDRSGNFDVYLMPAEGGRAVRLTHHSSDDFPTAFSADDQAVLFSSSRLDRASHAQFPTGRFGELYSISIHGGRPRMLMTTPAEEAVVSEDGSLILYEDRKGYENSWRKHHVSSVTRDIWTFRPEDGSYRKLTDYQGEDRDPVFSEDGKRVYYLSESSGTLNIYQMDLDAPENPTQLTFFEHHPVRFLTRANDGTLCFSYNGEIYTLNPGRDPYKLDIRILTDIRATVAEVVKLRDGATEMTLSPNGKELAFVVRGEVFSASVESGKTKQVTRTPQQERSVSFSPDGRSLLYASERDESWDLYRTVIAREEESYFFDATLLHEEPVLVSDAETFQPAYSPDGKEVAYLEERTTLKVLNLERKESRTILPGDKNYSYADGDQHYQWSPDGKWFLVEFLQPGYWFSEVGLIAADGKSEVVNLTESGFFDYQPRWMMGGDMILWYSDRDGLRGYANGGASEADVYAFFSNQKAFDRFKLSKEEYELLKEREEKEEKEKKEKEEKAEKSSKDGKKKKGKDKEKEALKPVKLEMEGLRDRKHKLSIHSARLAGAAVTPDGGKLLYLAQFEKGNDLWVTDLRTKETKVLAKLGAGNGALEMDKEGKNLFLLSNGKLSKVEIESGKAKPIGFSGKMALDPEAERAYLFEHVWRQVVKKFYDPNLHGADWDFLKREYARFLPHINNNYDFAEMLSELLGELNASHTGARYRHTAENGDETASLGVFYDENHEGEGLKILEIMTGSPLIQEGSRIEPGTVIEKIDGNLIAADANYYPMLNRKAGEKVLLSLLDEKSGGRWEETVKPINPGAESRLLYRRWVDTRRDLTEKLSGGRLGYVHVRSMSDASFRTTIEEVLGKQVTKEGLVVDTRFNGGGDLVDLLSSFLDGETYMDFKPPNQDAIGGEPSRKWTKPSIVLAGEANYSDAHCFPFAYQELKIGKVVGMPVAGTCTFVWWERLQDRSLVFGIPNMGVRNNAGQALENLQLEPDIRVANEPAQIAAGRDQQLEAAVAELLEILNTD